MANLAITNTFVASTTIVASEVNTNYTDVSGYINARNGGSTDWDFVSSAGLITAKDGIRSSDETAATPGYSFTADPDTGVFRSTTNTLDLSTGGISRFTLNTASLTTTLPFLSAAGTAAAPTYAFSGDPNSGLLSSAADQVGMSVGGTTRVTFTTGAFAVQDSAWQILARAGTAAAPGYSFNEGGRTDDGIYSSALSEVSIAINGVQGAKFSTAGFQNTLGQILARDTGTNASPDYSFAGTTNMGFLDATGTINVIIGGSQNANISATQWEFLDGTAAVPMLGFLLDPDSGVFRPTTNTVGLSAGGTERLRVDATAVARNTALLIRDVDNAALERVTVGVADSGGVGFKVLRIPN